jgi:hypothetical protein
LQRRETTQQSVEGDAHFDAGQLLAEALVNAVAEGQLAAGVAVDVQGVVIPIVLLTPQD